MGESKEIKESVLDPTMMGLWHGIGTTILPARDAINLHGMIDDRLDLEPCPSKIVPAQKTLTQSVTLNTMQWSKTAQNREVRSNTA